MLLASAGSPPKSSFSARNGSLSTEFKSMDNQILVQRQEAAWRWPLLLSLVVFVGSARPSPAQVIKSTVEFKSCVGVSTVMTEKNVCYVMNLATREQKVVVELCSGINVSGGTILLGGKASAMMCSTAEFPAGTDRKTAERVAEKRLREELENSRVQLALKRELNYSGPIKDVAPFTIKEDPAYEARLRRLLEDIEKAKRARPR
jgi:hypothetical protein